MQRRMETTGAYRRPTFSSHPQRVEKGNSHLSGEEIPRKKTPVISLQAKQKHQNKLLCMMYGKYFPLSYCQIYIQIHFVIYWRNVKLSAVIFAMCLVGLFLTIQYTFIHTVVLLLLLSLVICFIYITVKIAIDFFYNRDIKNPFSDYLKIALPAEEIITCAVEQFDYYLCTLLQLLFFGNTRASLSFGIILLPLSFVTNYLDISKLVYLFVILLFSVPLLFGWYWQVPDTLASSSEVLDKIREMLKDLKRKGSEHETINSSVPGAKAPILNCLCSIVHFVIYWRNVKLSAVIFAMCLVGLFLTIQYTFIHTVVLLLLLSLVICFICITVKIAIDFFYNREIKLLFRDYLRMALPKTEVKVYAVGKLNYFLNALICLLYFKNIKASLVFGVVLYLLSFVTNYLEISTLFFLVFSPGVILLFFIPPLYGWYCQVPNTVATASANELLNMIKEVLNHMRMSDEQKAELKDLINELEEVTDWFLLGLCLGLFESQLEVIKQDHKTNDERRREVLATWARQEKPTWSKVVCALMEMGDHQVLASQIAEKYGTIQSYSADKTSPAREGQSQSEGEQQVLLPNAQKPNMSLKDLLKELQPVTDWYNLGLYLDVPEHKLDDIQESNSGNTDDCRREMLMIWMESEVATWARVVHALIHIDQPVLAANIASKYGVPIPKSVIEKTQPQRPPTLTEQGTQSGTASEQTDEHQDGTQLKEVPITDLLTELQGVTDWFTLGVWLEVPTPLLKAIRKDHTDTDQCRLEMLIAWSKQEVPTWPRVVCAVGEMGMIELAIEIAEKYGVAIPPSLCESLDQKARAREEQATHQSGTTEDEDLSWHIETDVEKERFCVPEYHEGDIRSAKELLNELWEVTDWIPFGLYLGLAVPTLKQIQKEQLTTERCRREMLLTWGKEQTPTWLKVIQALVKIRRFPLAVKISSKYGVTVTQLLHQEMKKGAVSERELRYLKVERRGEGEVIAEQPNVNTGKFGDVSLKNLVNELQEVTDWFQLGLCLGVPESVLRTIQRDLDTTNKRKQEMLIEWMKRVQVPKWSTMVKALLDMGMIDQAIKIALIHFESKIKDQIQERGRNPEPMQDAGKGPRANVEIGPITSLFLRATGLATPID